MKLQIKSTFVFAFLVCGIIYLISSCKKTDTSENNSIIEPPDTVNLISNFSFEIDSKKSLSGWEIFCTNYDFITDVPVGGGNWALCMPSGWVPSYYYIETTVPAPIGKNEYRLSFYGKIRGSVFLFIKHPDTLLFCKRLSVHDTNWTYYSSIDTLTTNSGDSLTIQVVSGGSEVPMFCYFDLCKLELIK